MSFIPKTFNTPQVGANRVRSAVSHCIATASSDILGLATCLLVTDEYPGHAAMFMSQGSSDTGVLYDPAGSFARKNGGGNGDLIPANTSTVGAFAAHHMLLDGDRTNVTCHSTTKEQEEALVRRAEEVGGGSGLVCASRVSDVMRSSGVFPEVQHTWFPSSLERQFKKTTPKAPHGGRVSGEVRNVNK